VVQADHGRENEVERMFQVAIESFGHVDILMQPHRAADLLQALPQPPKAAGWGRQDPEHHVGPRGAGAGGAADYDCSKGALRNLTRTLVLEVSEMGMTVNNIAPGMVLTPFNQQAIDDPKVLEEQVQSIPLKRAAQPEEIGRLAVFLASSDGDYVTGATYVMDGGLMQMSGQGA